MRDLDAIREALGYPALNVYGVSYGSRVAQHYARRFPESTRTIIIDGVVPPQLPLGPGIALEAQRAIDEIRDQAQKEAQIIVTEACAPMIRHCMISAKYIAAKYKPEIGAQDLYRDRTRLTGGQRRRGQGLSARDQLLRSQRRRTNAAF